MKRVTVKIVAALLTAMTATILTGCASDADRVSQNISTEADQFRVTRQITFYNGITDKYIATVTGRCSVNQQTGVPKALAVICETSKGKYIKNMLGLSDNVTWFAIQVETTSVSPYHYEIVFKPQNVVPSFTGSDAN